MSEPVRNILSAVYPRDGALDKPVIDDLTQKITAAWRLARHHPVSGKSVICPGCGILYTFEWRELPDGRTLSCTCVHNMAYHRHEIPPDELQVIERLEVGLVLPRLSELMPPGIRTTA
jgi:hypothetical protein